MVKRSHHVTRSTTHNRNKETSAPKSGDDSPIFLGGGTRGERGPKSKDPEKEDLAREVDRLKSALLESTKELLLLKKSVSSV